MSWDGFTPVHAAAAYGHAAVLHMLLTFGGDPKLATPSGVRVPPRIRVAPSLSLPLTAHACIYCAAQESALPRMPRLPLSAVRGRPQVCDHAVNALSSATPA